MLKVFLASFYVSAVFASDVILINNSNGWLEKIFKSVDPCTPSIGLYFDAKSGKSDNSLIEKHGYKASKIADGFAYYNIKENFFGLNAYKIMIPANTDSLFQIYFNNTLSEVKSALEKNMGAGIEVYKQGFTAKNGVAYLIEYRPKSTSFTCYTFQE